MKRISLLSFLTLSGLSAEVRDWVYTDGDRSVTFSGEVVSYDEATNTVTINDDGTEASFTADKLSEKGREYLSTWNPKSDTAANSETEPMAEPATEPAATSAVAQLLAVDKLQRLSGEKFVETTLAKKPKYFLLYYSASW